MARFGSTSSFYWARVTKLYTSRGGERVCDVGWLRPQGGSPGGRMYAFEDGQEDTEHRDGLLLRADVRRPNSEELTPAAPPNAAASTAVSQETNLLDFLGDPVVPATTATTDLTGEVASAGPPLLAAQAPSCSVAAAETRAQALMCSGKDLTSGPIAAPAYGECGASALKPPLAAWPPSLAATAVAKPATILAPATAAQGCFGPLARSALAAPGSLVVDARPSATSTSVAQFGFTSELVPAGARDNTYKEERFDFVSQILSGALASA